MQVTTIGLDIAKNVLWPASPGRCWPRAAPIACLRLRQRRKESGDGRMRLRLASVRSRTAGVMTALMRNGRDRRLGEPVMGRAILERVLLFGTRSADYTRASGHNGCIATEVTLQAKTEAEYMTAPERFADGQIPLAPRAPSIHDPSVWTGRVLQAECERWRGLVLRFCIRPVNRAFVLLAIMDIRARPISF
jgi:hypothetical protein